MKRYFLFTWDEMGTGEQIPAENEESPDGWWTPYHEAKAEVSRLEEELAECREEIKDRKFVEDSLVKTLVKMDDKLSEAIEAIKSAREALTCPAGVVAGFKITEAIFEIDAFLDKLQKEKE